MKIFSAFFAVVLLSGVAFSADTVQAPVMPDKNRADILQIQKNMSDEKAQYIQLQTQLQQIQQAFEQNRLELDKAKADACAAVHADCDKEWIIDDNSLKFVARPKPDVKK